MKPYQIWRPSRKTEKSKSSSNKRKTSTIQLLKELDELNPFPKCSQPTVANLAFRAYIYEKWLLQGLRILTGSKEIDGCGYFCKTALLGYDDCLQKRKLVKDRIMKGIPKKCLMIPVKASIWPKEMNRGPYLKVNGKHKNCPSIRKSVSYHPATSPNFLIGNPFLGTRSTKIYTCNPMNEEPGNKLRAEVLPFHNNLSSSPKMDILSSKLDSSPQFGTRSPGQNVRGIFTNQELHSFERIMGSPTLYAPINPFQQCHDVYSSCFCNKVADISVSPWKTDTPNLFSPIFSSAAVE